MLRGLVAVSGVAGGAGGCLDANGGGRTVGADATDTPDTELRTKSDEDVDASGETDIAIDDGEVRGAIESAIHDRVNDVRLEHDRSELAYNAGIAAVARSHSTDMVEREYFSHYSPDGTGASDRLADYYPGHCRSIGENIANVGVGGDEGPDAVADRVVTGWMNSAGHRENLLNERFDEQGIGVAVSDADRVLATENFCGIGDG